MASATPSTSTSGRSLHFTQPNELETFLQSSSAAASSASSTSSNDDIHTLEVSSLPLLSLDTTQHLSTLLPTLRNLTSLTIHTDFTAGGESDEATKKALFVAQAIGRCNNTLTSLTIESTMFDCTTHSYLLIMLKDMKALQHFTLTTDKIILPPISTSASGASFKVFSQNGKLSKTLVTLSLTVRTCTYTIEIGEISHILHLCALQELTLNLHYKTPLDLSGKMERLLRPPREYESAETSGPFVLDNRDVIKKHMPKFAEELEKLRKYTFRRW